MDFSEYSGINADFYDILKSECVDISNSEFDTINPDDFLSESFLNELKAQDARKSTSSESSCSFENISNPQLTPPISPQPIVIDNSRVYQGIQIIPINAIQTSSLQQLNYTRQERKIVPIVPKPSNGSSSESETNQGYLISNVSSKTSSPVDKALIKQARLIRNRESALMSRRKKKEYVQNLENEVQSLRKENGLLKDENSLLKARLKGYGNFGCQCAARTLSSKLPNKNASLMLALIFMIGFNVIPFFGNLLTTTNSIKKTVAQQTNVFPARHLLYTTNVTDTFNSSSDKTENESDSNIPLYINQTDLIRKANIENIRSWIHQPDLFNVSIDDQLFADKWEDKLAKMHEKSRDQMNRTKMKKKKTQKKKTASERKIDNNIQFYDTSFFKLHEFFEEINRKEDTFYLFSFKSDHLLLPAIDYPQNFSQIIKMNLIMPQHSNNESLSSDKITMMQIETIILNTSLIQITEKSIPGEFKAPYSNSTQTPLCNNENPQRNLNNFERSKKQAFQRAKFAPYFGPQFDLSAAAASINSRK